MVPHQSAHAPIRPEDDVAAGQAYLNLARSLRQLGQQVIGLWPVPAPLTFDEVPRHLAMAMVSLGMTVALVVPRDRWSDDPSQGPVILSGLGDSVDSITPVWSGRSSSGAVVEHTLAFLRDRYACVLLDLSGFDVGDAHEVALIPGVALAFLVAQGRISDHALVKLTRRIPRERRLGAVLVESPGPGVLA